MTIAATIAAAAVVLLVSVVIFGEFVHALLRRGSHDELIELRARRAELEDRCAALEAEKRRGSWVDPGIDRLRFDHKRLLDIVTDAVVACGEPADTHPDFHQGHLVASINKIRTDRDEALHVAKVRGEELDAAEQQLAEIRAVLANQRLAQLRASARPHPDGDGDAC